MKLACSLFIFLNSALIVFANTDSLLAVQSIQSAIAKIDVLDKNEFDDAVQISFQNFIKSDDLFNFLNWHNKIGRKFKSIGQSELAVRYLRNGIEKAWRKPKNRSELIKYASITGMLGSVYRKGLNDFRSAMIYYEKYKVLYRDSLKNSPIKVSRYVYNPLGNIYYGLRDYKKAEHYYDLARTTAKDEEDWNLFSMVSINLASFFDDTEREENAIEIYNEVLEIDDKLSLKEKVKIRFNIGLCYYALGEYKKARVYTSDANKIVQSNASEFSIDAFQSYKYDYHYNLGRICEGEKKHKESENNFIAAIKLLNQSSGANSQRQLATMHNNLGRLLSQQNKFDKSANNFQEAIKHISKDLHDFIDPFTVPSNKLIGEEQLAITYHNLGLLYKEKYVQQKDLNDLKKAIKYFELTNEVNHIQLNLYSSERSNLTALENDRQIQEDYQKAMYDLWLITKDDSLIEKMFLSSENSRSTLLSKNMAINKIFRSAERDTLEYQRLNDSRKAITEAIFKSDKEIKEIQKLKTQLIEIEDSISKFNLGNYIAPSGITIASIQNELAENQALIEYFMGEEDIFIYSVTNDLINVYRQELSPDVTMMVDQLRFNIQEYNNELNAIEKSASNLYNILLATPLSNLSHKITRLIIIKDQELNFIPFELLRRTHKTNNANPKYLLEDFAISYSYSGSIFQVQSQIPTERANELFLGYAPTYNAKNLIPIDTMDSPLIAGLVRSGNYDLLGAKKELTEIANLLNGKKILGSEASEDHFKKHAAQYQILLLSMHGIANMQNPDFSELLFSPNAVTKNQEDNLLHPIEIYDMPLNADLVVLSACETGYGKLYPGEGVFSFARSFTASGVPSTLMTLWKVVDSSTAGLVIDFFKNIKDGQPKDIALQQAKLSYLKQNKNNSEFLHPYFWSGLQISGNTKALDLQVQGFLRPLYIFICFVILALLYYFFRFKR